MAKSEEVKQPIVKKPLAQGVDISGLQSDVYAAAEVKINWQQEDYYGNLING